MSTSQQNSTGNPILDNPGASATIFAIVVLLVFVGALYNTATSHHGDSKHGGDHGSDHKAAPSAH